MTFDNNISENISLSKILDAFLLEEEEPKVIIDFLKKYDNDITDIMRYSLYHNRLFQLDYILKCSTAEASYLIDKLNNNIIPANEAAFLAWQILRSRSAKAQDLQYRMRLELRCLSFRGMIHPYSNRHESYIKPLDDLCFKMAEENRISEIPCIAEPRKLDLYLKYINYSLFQHRILQYDFFTNLDEISKYLLIKSAYKLCSIQVLKCFTIQIFDSDESFEVKKLCYDELKNRISIIDILDENTFNTIKECHSFQELILKMTIFNNDISQFLVLYLMFFKHKWIYEWIDYDKDDLNMNLNISDFMTKMQNRHDK